MLEDWLEIGGIVSLIVLVVIICLIPTIATIIVGMWIAGQLGLTGIVWWAFIILFWLVISSILARLSTS